MFLLIKNKWDVQQSLAVALMCALALSGCGEAPKANEAGDTGSNPTSLEPSAAPATQSAPAPLFSDGSYEYSPDVNDGRKSCDQNNKCLTLEDYKKICEQVSGITKSMADNALINFSGKYESLKLLSNHMAEDVESKWLDADRFAEEFDIKGACEITVTVSGVYNGSSIRDRVNTYASDFIVSNGEVLMEYGYYIPQY